MGTIAHSFHQCSWSSEERAPSQVLGDMVSSAGLRAQVTPAQSRAALQVWGAVLPVGVGGTRAGRALLI